MMERVRVYLPKEDLQRMEELVIQGEYLHRNEIFRQAVREFFDHYREGSE